LQDLGAWLFFQLSALLCFAYPSFSLLSITLSPSSSSICLLINVPLFQLRRSAPDWFFELLHYIGNHDKKKVLYCERGFDRDWSGAAAAMVQH